MSLLIHNSNQYKCIKWMKHLGNCNGRCYNGRLLHHIVLVKYKVPDGQLPVEITSTADEHRDYYNIQAFAATVGWCCMFQISLYNVGPHTSVKLLAIGVDVLYIKDILKQNPGHLCPGLC